MKQLTKIVKSKTALMTLLALTAVTAAQVGYASPNAANGGQSAGGSSIVAAINKLGDKIVALAEAGAKSVNQLMYQFDKDLPSTVKANTVTVKNKTLTQTINKETQAASQQNITHTLQEISYSVTPPKQGTEAYQQLKNYRNHNSSITLSAGTKASDSLYTAPNDHPYQAQILGVAKPKANQLHNNYFNYASLIMPTAYTSPELQAAKRFVQYATKDYAPLTEGIDLSALRNKSPAELKKFISSPAWQKYQLNIRSMMAARSIILNNLNHLIAERNPIKKLGNNAGLSTKSASPLQLEKYIATHRATNKKWYQQMQAASPATVQRETLFVLAEIEKQNYQAHLDRERLLAAITGIELQTEAANQLMAKAQIQPVNKAINDVADSKTMASTLSS